MGLSYSVNHKHMDNETTFRLENAATETKNVTRSFDDPQVSHKMKTIGLDIISYELKFTCTAENEIADDL